VVLTPDQFKHKVLGPKNKSGDEEEGALVVNGESKPKRETGEATAAAAAASSGGQVDSGTPGGGGSSSGAGLTNESSTTSQSKEDHAVPGSGGLSQAQEASASTSFKGTLPNASRVDLGSSADTAIKASASKQQESSAHGRENQRQGDGSRKNTTNPVVPKVSKKNGKGGDVEEPELARANTEEDRDSILRW
jgi:dienelactone hydrolase